MLSRKAFVSNLKIIRSRLKTKANLHRKDAKIMAVVKADAYGHWTSQIAPELKKHRVNQFAVASVEEAVELRKFNAKATILVFGGSLRWSKRAIEQVRRHRLKVGINDLESLKLFLKKPDIPIHIKLDTGMNRLGIKSDEWGQVHDWLLKSKRKIDGLYTHYATFKGPDFRRQVMLFEEAVRWMKASGISVNWVHSENSAAIFSPERFKKGVLSETANLVRPGLSLFGYLPGNFKGKSQLQPVLEMVSEIGLVKRVKKGEGVSYDFLYRAPRSHDYAVVPIGYADGIAKDYVDCLKPRFSNEKTGALRICGSICMDMLMLRSMSGDLKAGDRVVFWGRFPNELLKKKVVSPYELNLRVSNRIPRIWVP